MEEKEGGGSPPSFSKVVRNIRNIERNSANPQGSTMQIETPPGNKGKKGVGIKIDQKENS